MSYCPTCGGAIGPETGYICSHCYRILTGYDPPKYHANTYANVDFLPDTYIGGGRPERRNEKTQRDEPIKDGDEGGRMDRDLYEAYLLQAIDEFGYKYQIEMMLSNMIELSERLWAYKHDAAPVPCPENHAEAILEAIADVQISLDQMRLMFGDERDVVGGWDYCKIHELVTRLDALRRRSSVKKEGGAV